MRSRFCRTKAMCAIALVAIALSGCIEKSTATRDESGTVVEGGMNAATNLRVGDCWNDVDEEVVTTLPLVPCSEPHDNEVYAVIQLDDDEYLGDDDEFPGDDDIYEIAEWVCYEPFADFVGTEWEDSELDYMPLYPTEIGWRAVKDREVACSVWDPAGKLEGSVEGSGR